MNRIISPIKRLFRVIYTNLLFLFIFPGSINAQDKSGKPAMLYGPPVIKYGPPIPDVPIAPTYPDPFSFLISLLLPITTAITLLVGIIWFLASRKKK